ncbi:MAG: tetraacyldisaccharide 4'-kinase [Candidatus Omnitrophica bacterium]|nr:tetraacyldisaccharide 4'-kinase [Candidatus Omnitrophota bacterium]MCF7893533.1 tetraacyldisaccharide 4'-kinase [Candidatus Omnitrophota bacterium]
MSVKTKIKMSYIKFAEKRNHSFLGKILYIFFYCLSLIYAALVKIRNFFYNRNIFSSYNSDLAFLIGVGNISWAGTGKTPLCLWLYKQLNLKFKTAILRRGYGQDEGKLIKKECSSVFSSCDRVNLVKNLEKDYNLFIVDDSFQYRKLKKDLEIVIMGEREFSRKIDLIPASFFREPLKNIKRADILIVNYHKKIKKEKIKSLVYKIAPKVKIYFANYLVDSLEDLEGKVYNLNILKNKKLAAFAAIGYPQGFFDLLKKVGFNPEKKIRYPDHYNLSKKEYSILEQNLLNSEINSLVVTKKDKYHLPAGRKKIDIFVLGVKLEIEDKEKLIEDITKKINNKIS